MAEAVPYKELLISPSFTSRAPRETASALEMLRAMNDNRR
jgi:hypothetical protein